MATINKTIASSGADYTSLSLFEASIPGAGADTYIGTYVEALSDTTAVIFSFGSSNTCEVDVQAAYRCNGAVSGSHAEIVLDGNSATDTLDLALTTIRNLRIKRTNNTNTAGDAVNIASSSSNFAKLDRCTIISDNSAGRVIRVASSGTGVPTIKNCFIVDRNKPAGGAGSDVVFIQCTGSVPLFYRNTVFLANSTAAGLVRSHGAGTAVDARQNVAIKAAGATATNGCYYTTTSGTFGAGCDANGASDSTSPGTHANNSLTPGDVLTTLTVGSEDLHYPSRAAMTALTAGSDVSATTGTTDIDGDTIAAWYPGADYVPASAAAASGGGTPGLAFRRLRFGLRGRN